MTLWVVDVGWNETAVVRAGSAERACQLAWGSGVAPLWVVAEPLRGSGPEGVIAADSSADREACVR